MLKRLLYGAATFLAAVGIAVAAGTLTSYNGYLTSVLSDGTKITSVVLVDKDGVAVAPGSGGTASNFSSAFPSAGTAIGQKFGANMVPFVSTNGTALDINCTVGCSGGTFNNNADNVATSATNGQAAAWQYLWDGATWDRQPGNSTAGATVSGSGTAGTAATGVVTVQGIASMTPFLVNPGTAANFGVGATGAAVPANAGYTGMNVGGNTTGLAGSSAGADDVSNTLTGMNVYARMSVFDGTTWDRAAGDSTNGQLVNLGANNDVVVNSGGITSGAMVDLGAKADATCGTSTGTCSLISLIKFLNSTLGGVGAIAAAPPATAVILGANGSGATGGLTKGVITCDLHAKYDASDNGSITMVTGVSGRKVYICGYILAVGGTATNLKLREGSDANCATAAADLTPAYQLTANQSIGANSAFWNGLAVSTNAYYVCINASAGNAHQAELWYTIL